MPKNWPPILAIDFDGTITKYDDFSTFSLDTPPMEDAVEVINELYDAGCIIIIWTCRDGEHVEHMKEWLRKYKIPYSYINQNIPDLPFATSRKIYADKYIDNRDIKGFCGWKEVRDIVFMDEWFNSG